MKAIKIITALIIFLMAAVACKKSFHEGKMQIKLTDAPAEYQSVFIDLQKVMVHYEGRPEDKWIELKSKPGIYDLLTLRNNVNVVIADDEHVPIGKISQIRLVLGKNNSVVVEGTTFGLQIPSSDESGLKINVHETLRRNDLIMITLDFDAEASVNLNGNGEYIMKPVIKVKEIINN
jgi:hypothetical protein